MNPRVKDVVVLDNYRLRLTFTNGEQRIFDVKPYLKYPAFKRLGNQGYFSLARTEHGTVSWPNDIDFCPDTLFLDSVREVPVTYAPEKSTE
jgi:hypothetical protein